MRITTTRRAHPGTTILALALVALVVPATLAAAPRQGQEGQAGTVTGRTDAMAPPEELLAPRPFDEAAIGLGEAVRLTLERDPRIQAEKQELMASLGILRQARGFFDQLVQVNPSFSYVQQELQAFLKDREQGKRILLDQLSLAFGELATALDEFLADSDQLLPPRCPAGLDLVILSGGGTNILVGRNLSSRTGLQFSDAFSGFAAAPTGDATDFFALCNPGTSQPSTRIFEQINQILGAGINLREVPLELVTLEREIAEAVAFKAGLAFERVGELPKDLTTKTLGVQAGWFKPWRNGLETSVNVSMRTSEQNFKDKSLDPAFGGLGVQNQFPNEVSVTLDVPLGRGRGRVSTGAPERAAELTVRARREQLRHTLTEEVFQTVIAYINLVAAQESLSLLEESSARQQQLVQATGALVQSGDLAAAERDRVAARAAGVQRAVADARLSVLDAQYVLADAIGLLVEGRADVPAASDGFIQSLQAAGDTGGLIEGAHGQRRDLRAVTHLRDASEVLADAARRDLQRQIDFRITGGMSTLYESPAFKQFPDELDEPTEEPVRFNNPRGIFRSFDEKWSPFVMASVNMSFPFGNNVAQGRFLQRTSSLTTSEIRRANLERLIQDNVVDIADAMEYARQVVERRRETVGYYQQTLDASLTQYESGDISLTDTILTEDELTSERLQLVQAMQTYLSLLTRLRFETGELVTFAQEDTVDERVEFQPAQIVMQQ